LKAGKKSTFKGEGGGKYFKNNKRCASNTEVAMQALIVVKKVEERVGQLDHRRRELFLVEGVERIHILTKNT